MTNLPSNAPWQPGSVQENEWVSDVLTQYGRQAYILALQMVGHAGDAEDVLQESILKLVRKARKQPIRKPGAYLNAVIRTTALDVLARRQAERLARVAAEDCQMGKQQIDPPKMAQSQASSPRLRLAIAQLPPRLAEVMIRRGIQEQSYAKIAQEMGISRNTARVYYWQALRELQKVFFGN